jgi:hypothetical protein
MKAEKTIREALRWLNISQGHPRLRGDRAFDQVYGAAEALRWALGEGPNPTGLNKPLGRSPHEAP